MTFAGTRLITISAIRIRAGIVIPVSRRIRDMQVGVRVAVVIQVDVLVAVVMLVVGLVAVLVMGVALADLAAVLVDPVVAVGVRARRRHEWLITSRGVV
jgi:hypothetical protein